MCVNVVSGKYTWGYGFLKHIMDEHFYTAGMYTCARYYIKPNQHRHTRVHVKLLLLFTIGPAFVNISL